MTIVTGGVFIASVVSLNPGSRTHKQTCSPLKRYLLETKCQLSFTENTEIKEMRFKVSAWQ